MLASHVMKQVQEVQMHMHRGQSVQNSYSLARDSLYPERKEQYHIHRQGLHKKKKEVQKFLLK